MSTRGRRKGSRNKRLRRNTTVDGLIVEEAFGFSNKTTTNHDENGENNQVGEGCYVSGIIGGRKYYGILIEQSALSAATDMFFKSEGLSLEMNRRMMSLRDMQGDKKDVDGEGPAKKPKLEREAEKKQIQKFRYVESSKVGESGGPGYRDLLATYADVNAASEDNEEKAVKIKEACDMGGNYVGEYYYQYEVTESTLHVTKIGGNSTEGQFDIWSSIGFHTFLRFTPFPNWFPLSNKSGQQRKVLQMLHMERKNTDVAWNADNASASLAMPRLLPMQPRSHFRIGIIGGGISGLGSAHELLRLAESENIDIEVVVLEARDRFGGRLNTDYTSFKSNDNTPFPIDIGGSWIHGIDKNPLANLALQANIQFVPTSDDVKMLQGNMAEVDKNIDKRAGKLFDDILDAAAEQCWAEDPNAPLNAHNAIRWYANGTATQVHPYRHSTDIAIDAALSQVVHKRSDLRDQLSSVEKNLLLWNTKNLEYALAGNIRDLSMKYWDASEGHEFKGDHVLLKQGYSSIVNHILEKCKSYSNFKYQLDFVVHKIEYGRKTTNIPYLKQHEKNFIPLSDTCCVTSATKTETFDFLISSLPLGVLKNRAKETQGNIVFDPPLPFWKADSIDATGFGLLNKVILQFPFAFWRQNTKREFLRGTPFLGEEQFLIGNASGKNSEHYIFYDVGKFLSDNINTAPPILMTLISGVDAVISEQLTKENLVGSVLETLKHLYSNVDVPPPLNAIRTKWGSDPYSRGSYTFLPPGATNEDYQMLQYPINENSETYTVDETDTMRLFWCGEHTTSFHPSTAHGAYLSGLRAAKEVIGSMFSKSKERVDNRNETQIPLLYYRLKHPTLSLDCHMCQKSGNRSIEGPLLSFQRANRRILIHLNCAKYTPDVMIVDGTWKNVFKALNRAKQLKCALCRKTGASIGCGNKDCNRSYHYHCCLETGWSFRDISFLCDLHRSHEFMTNDTQESVISVDFFRSKNPFFPPQCFFCSQPDQIAGAGKLLGFQLGAGQILAHEKCVRYSNIIQEGTWSENAENYFNVFKTFNSGQNCIICNKDTATIKCAKCPSCFHYPCAKNTGWDLETNKESLCPQHRPQQLLDSTTSQNGGIQHNLFNPVASTAASQAPLAKHNLFDYPTSTTSNEALSQPKHNLFNLSSTSTNEPPLQPKHNLFNPTLSTTANEPSFKPEHSLLNPILSTNINEASLAKHNLLNPMISNITSQATVNHNLLNLAVSNLNSQASLQANHNLFNPTSSMPSQSTSSLEKSTTNSVEKSNSNSAQKPPGNNSNAVKMFTLDPHIKDPEIGSTYILFEALTATRTALSDLWGINLTISQTGVNNTTTLRIPLKPPNMPSPPPPYGLMHGDIIIQINGIKLGSPELVTITQLQSLMKSVTELRIMVLRKPDNQDSSLV